MASLDLSRVLVSIPCQGPRWGCRMGESSYVVIGEVAWFRLTGNHVLESGVRQVTDAIIRTKQRSLEKLLVDITTITGAEPPSLDKLYWLMGAWAHAGRSSVRVAIVTRPEFMRADRVGVAVGLKQGFSANVFETEKQALDWLTGRRS